MPALRVYKAEDTTLGRTVALKFLAPHLISSSEVRKRFIREARTAAALQHPNICTVFEIGEAEGHTFISMSCLEGRELAEEIEQGPIDAARALDLAVHFAEGLAEAHSKGVVHRDIKPANLFVASNGRGVILDFGLAQLASADSKLTREGSTLGTCAYMSPEQAMGADIDARSDVWALGCVLYEMLSGHAPFRGHYEQAIVYSILNEQPEPLEDVAPDLVAIIERCLAKNPQERYENGGALLEALQERLASARTKVTAEPSDVPRVAVLPLKTRANDAEMESFAEGLTEEITSGLSQFRHLVVVSASAAAGVQGQSDIRSVGKELGARFLLEGSIRKAGSSIRVGMQLLDTTTGAHLWAESFDRDFVGASVFAVQDELTDRIVATVAEESGVLTRSLASLARQKPIDALTTHDCVLRMYAFWQRIRPDEHAEVRDAIEQTLEREPDHAEALACLAILYLEEFRQEFNPRPAPLDRALHKAQKAVELDGTSQLPMRALAEIQYFRRDLRAFRQAADRVLSLNPRDSGTVAMMGALRAFGGDWEQGCAIVKKMMLLNPHHAGWFHAPLMLDHYRLREYEKALEAAKKINMPGFFWMHLGVAIAEAQLGRPQTDEVNFRKGLQAWHAMNEDPRAELSKWFVSEEFVEHLIDGLRKARVQITSDAAVEDPG